MSTTMVTPLFVNDMFNRTGKKVRVLYVKTVACENTSYDLYIRDSKNPENSYPNSEDDRFYLHVLINGWLIPLRMTERYLRQQAVRKPLVAKMYGDEAGRKAVFHSFREGNTQYETDKLITAQLRKEDALEIELGRNGAYWAEYIHDMLQSHIQAYTDCKAGTSDFPDFIGAAILDDLANCTRLSDLRRKAREEKAKAAEEKERQAKEEALAKFEADVSAAKAAILNDGTITGSGIILTLADRYQVPIAIRTRGWIKSSFISCEFSGPSLSVRFWKKKGCTCSSKIYDVLRDIQAVVRQENDPPEEECP